MAEEQPVKAHLRVTEFSDVPDGDLHYYTLTFVGNDGEQSRDDFRGVITYVDRDNKVELGFGTILTLVFSEDVDFTPPDPVTETKTTTTRKS